MITQRPHHHHTLWAPPPPNHLRTPHHHHSNPTYAPPTLLQSSAESGACALMHPRGDDAVLLPSQLLPAECRLCSASRDTRAQADRQTGRQACREKSAKRAAANKHQDETCTIESSYTCACAFMNAPAASSASVGPLCTNAFRAVSHNACD